MQFDSRTVGRHLCGRAVPSGPGAQFIITGDNFADGPPIPIPLGAADPSLAGTRGSREVRGYAYQPTCLPTMVRFESKPELVSRFQTNVIQGLWRRGKGVRVARTGWKGPRGANVPRRKEGWARVEGASGAVYMAKGASPEPYRSLTLKFKETDNSFPFRRASVLQYHIPFLSFHCLVKPALIIKDCYPGSYA